MARSDLFYLRFMDDILVLAPTRWRFRKAVNEVLGSLGLLTRPGAITSRHESVRCDKRHSPRMGTRATVAPVRLMAAVRPG